MSSISEDVVLISPREAAELLRGRQIRAIDVREPSEFASSRIVGGEHASLGSLEKAATGWKQDEPLFVYCQTGKRSEQARAVLSRLGFTRVVSLDGGLSAWAAAGLPTEKSAGAPWSLERQVRFAVALFVIAFTSLGLWVHPAFFTLDFLISAGLIFSAVTNTCGMALVLTKMPWNRI